MHKISPLNQYIKIKNHMFTVRDWKLTDEKFWDPENQRSIVSNGITHDITNDNHLKFLFFEQVFEIRSWFLKNCENVFGPCLKTDEEFKRLHNFGIISSSEIAAPIVTHCFENVTNDHYLNEQQKMNLYLTCPKSENDCLITGKLTPEKIRTQGGKAFISITTAGATDWTIDFTGDPSDTLIIKFYQTGHVNKGQYFQLSNLLDPGTREIIFRIHNAKFETGKFYKRKKEYENVVMVFNDKSLEVVVPYSSSFASIVNDFHGISTGCGSTKFAKWVFFYFVSAFSKSHIFDEPIRQNLSISL